jgi:hypothetical protein
VKKNFSEVVLNVSESICPFLKVDLKGKTHFTGLKLYSRICRSLLENAVLKTTLISGNLILISICDPDYAGNFLKCELKCEVTTWVKHVQNIFYIHEFRNRIKYKNTFFTFYKAYIVLSITTLLTSPLLQLSSLLTQRIELLLQLLQLSSEFSYPYCLKNPKNLNVIVEPVKYTPLYNTETYTTLQRIFMRSKKSKNYVNKSVSCLFSKEKIDNNDLLYLLYLVPLIQLGLEMSIWNHYMAIVFICRAITIKSIIILLGYSLCKIRQLYNINCCHPVHQTCCHVFMRTQTRIKQLGFEEKSKDNIANQYSLFLFFGTPKPGPMAPLLISTWSKCRWCHQRRHCSLRCRHSHRGHRGCSLWYCRRLASHFDRRSPTWKDPEQHGRQAKEDRDVTSPKEDHLNSKFNVSYFIFSLNFTNLLTNSEGSAFLEIDVVLVMTKVVNVLLLRLELKNKNICFVKNITGLCPVLVLGMRTSVHIPLKPRSRHARRLCGPSNKYKLTFIVKLKNPKNNNDFFDLKPCLICRCFDLVTSLVRVKLMFDIEPNPGPIDQAHSTDKNKSITVITLNCRGLGNLKKFRLILNKAARFLTKNPYTIIMLQETMVSNERYLDLAWKGKYAITYGTGKSQGCITLTGAEFSFANQINFDHRGHYIELLGILSEPIAVINVYAPNGYALDKREYFDRVLDQIEICGKENIILAGDFNLTFYEMDRHKRGTCNGEINIGTHVSERLTDLSLEDAWQGVSGMTWRRGNVMSRLDRIFLKLNGFKRLNITSDWTLSDSDHAAVILNLGNNLNKTRVPKICKLDPQVVTNPEALTELRQYLFDQLSTVDINSTPHFKLEFVKMTIRTKSLEISKALRDAEVVNLKFINDDIRLHEELLKGSMSSEEVADVILHIEQLTNEKNRILNQQGEQLAWKAKTKWYNEGEKSNKYFLNLLKSKNARNEMSSIRENDQIITDPKEINDTVNDYYNKLYNGSKPINEDDGSYLADLFNLNEAEANSVNAPLTLQELWLTLRPLKDSAPGPDGISHIYLKKLWDIIGPIILDAWNFSITTKTLPPSYTRSYLRLIPKAGKDTSLLKNWRPITLSNCDLKLITRVYNNRLIKSVANYITNTQTAYIRGRNITDNVRLINSAIQLSSREPQINGSIIALDAQKAFDSVSHGYLNRILDTIGLQSFTPIFQLLYKDLQNDLVINGEVVGSHKISNGVKQGDALSCTLFILAMEPLLKKIEKNDVIKSIESVTLQYKWPKVVGYADDITCITINDIACKQAIFNEYEKFTNVAGLKLNADKTEIYNFAGRMHNNLDPLITTNVTYLGNNYEIMPVKEIKINGVTMSKNVERSKELNCATLIQKMDKHLKQWHKRSLSLLGRIQIFKTFGLSQFLYHFATFEPTPNDWKAIQTRINKFLWNKNYANNLAPARIKKEVMYAPISIGGFGMIDIKEVVTSVRLRRHFALLQYNLHPLSDLLHKLTDEIGYLGTQPLLNIEEILTLNIKALSDKRKADCNGPEWQIESDLILHSNLLTANIVDMIRPRKRESPEYHKLQRLGMKTFEDILRNPRQSLAVLTKISEKSLVNVITIMGRLYRGVPLPNPTVGASDKLRDQGG